MKKWALILAAFMAVVVAAFNEPPPPGEAGGDASPPSVAEIPVADNSFCFVCHVNYREEKLAVRHARNNVGCTKCHGGSGDHCDDEDNVTPPNVMYTREKVAPECMKCHPKAKLQGTEGHKPYFQDDAAKKKACTECHGEHRLGLRTVRWDKNTGELLAEE
jgi:hypothetical protein